MKPELTEEEQLKQIKEFMAGGKCSRFAHTGCYSCMFFREPCDQKARKRLIDKILEGFPPEKFLDF